MSMEARDPVRAYLNSVLEYRMEIRRLRRKIEQLEARATSITASLTGMPRGGGADRDAVLVALADVTGEYYKKLNAAEQGELDVISFIDSLPTSEHRLILKLRYVDRKRWPKVLAALKDGGYDLSERQMYRLHGAALNEARHKFNEQKETDTDDTK
jgi:hypothetical protein